MREPREELPIGEAERLGFGEHVRDVERGVRRTARPRGWLKHVPYVDTGLLLPRVAPSAFVQKKQKKSQGRPFPKPEEKADLLYLASSTRNTRG